MSKAVKSVFGGSDDSAQKAQVQQNELATRLAAERAKEARADVSALFPAADINRNMANFAAQEQVVGGLPQILNAIRGLPVDISGLQARDISHDFITSPQALAPNQQPNSALPLNVQQAIAGLQQGPNRLLMNVGGRPVRGGAG